MKLIDLDEIEYFTLVDKAGVPRYKIEIGDGLPIVNAIPVEWLYQKRSLYLENGCYMSLMVINELLNWWEKEHEKDI